MLVSFIIPSYNSAHTVARCLDSIFALPIQPSEYEVIFIDDCSRETPLRNATTAIVERYATTYPNLTLLCQPFNNRQGAARNRGISMAKGDYVCFVDSDDAVTEGIVSALRMAEEWKAEMVAVHFARTDEHEQITSEAQHVSLASGQLVTGIEMQNAYPYWCSAPWGYIYAQTFLKQVNYPFAEGALYEDSDFVAVHLYHARRLLYSPELAYIAYFRQGSTTHTCCYQNTADYLLLGTRMLAFYDVLQKDIVQRLSSDSEPPTADDLRAFAEELHQGE